MNLPNNGKFDVPLQLTEALADITGNMSITMAREASSNHRNMFFVKEHQKVHKAQIQ